jgi:glycosyltransferase involved in cell wall biosynthesis
MKFSICIPNYNYGRYLGETVRSALAQTYPDLEVHVADNNSTDDSIDVLAAIDDARLSWHRNNRNVGFAPNLDRAVAGTNGDRVILLSSDDLMRPDALATYMRVLDWLGDRAPATILSSTCDVINRAGGVVGFMRPPHWCWGPRDINWTLSATLGATVYEKPAEAVLERSLALMRNPVWFASTAYPRALYEEVEGYRGQGLINPDKEFHWRVISAAETVVFIDLPLFSYRVHPFNQDAQQARSGALKRQVDQYVLSFNSDPIVRERAGYDADDLARNFIREDIAKRSILSLIERDPATARRIVAFGRAAYPELMRSEPVALLAQGLAMAGPLTAPLLARIGPFALRRQLDQKSVIRRALTDTSPIRDQT